MKTYALSLANTGETTTCLYSLFVFSSRRLSDVYCFNGIDGAVKDLPEFSNSLCLFSKFQSQTIAPQKAQLDLGLS
jgi:hypothetical protein